MNRTYKVELTITLDFDTNQALFSPEDCPAPGDDKLKQRVEETLERDMFIPGWEVTVVVEK